MARKTVVKKLERAEALLPGGYIAAFPELPGCITMGETEEAAKKNAEDAKLAWLEAAIEDGFDIPGPITE